MDYILENIKTGEKIAITADQKKLLETLADIEYTPVDSKIYVINKNKYITNVIR